MLTLTSILRTRLRALLEEHGLSASRVARDMGRSHTWLVRKLDLSHPQARPLRTEDCDEVLAHLGLGPAALLSPVLLAGDVELLRFCTVERPFAEIARVFRDADTATTRLEGQGLLCMLDDADPNSLLPPAGLTTPEGITLTT